MMPNKSIRFEFTNITPMNSRAKLEKAVHLLARELGVPVETVRRNDEGTGEAFHFAAQEELTYQWYDYFTQATKDIYGFVISYFGLSEQNVLQKAGELTYKGKVIYSPETGQPIKKADWDKFVAGLEKMLNQKFGGAGKKIVLDSRTLGRILDRMLKYSKMPEVKDMKLGDIRYSGKTYDWIKDSARNAEKVFGAVDGARLSLLQQSAAERITGMSEQIKHDVRQILIDGAKAHKSRQQISLDLFNSISGANRNFQKIADTEIQNNINNAYLAEEVAAAKPDEKIYFQRIEINDGNACDFCKRMNGVVALWSKTPLADDKVKNDPYATVAIWEGKDWNGQKNFVANGVFHPWCRGMWTRYAVAFHDAFTALQKNRTAQWNAAVDKAREEWKEKGIENPNDKTHGYTDRINELYINGVDKGDSE